MKKKYLVIILILIILAIIASIIFKQYKNSKRSDVKIPILLYHDFVTIVPDYDSDNFSYINTPQSFEENIKVLLENGYTFLSMKELYDANNGKIELPAKPILITMDDGYYSNYEYIYPILKKYHVKASIFVVTDKIGFHYTVSKDSFSRLETVVNETIDTFKTKRYFDKVSLLRFVPHGKGTTNMDLSKEELLAIKNLYLNSNYKDKIRLGTPWNILGIENTPCIIADEIMIIGFDGIAYPCDSIKYFTKLGISGNIRENSLTDMYNSEYFSNIRKFNTDNSCSFCGQYSICKNGCIGQKIIANYTESNDKVLTLKMCINTRDSKCMR